MDPYIVKKELYIFIKWLTILITRALRTTIQIIPIILSRERIIEIMISLLIIQISGFAAEKYYYCALNEDCNSIQKACSDTEYYVLCLAIGYGFIGSIFLLITMFKVIQLFSYVVIVVLFCHFVSNAMTIMLNSYMTVRNNSDMADNM